MPKGQGKAGQRPRGGPRGKGSIRRASERGAGHEPRPVRGPVELAEIVAKHRAHRKLQLDRATAVFAKNVPETRGSFFDLYTANTGKKWVGHADKFKPPSQITQTNVKALMHAINAFENDPSTANFAQIQALADQLHLIMWRIPEDPSVVVFVANQQDTPIITGAALAWRYGAMANPAMLTAPHEGQDTTQFLGTSMFLNCPQFAKFLLGNAFNPNIIVYANINQPYRIGHVKRPADMAHALTIGATFEGTFRALYPTGVGFILHGHYMANTQAIIGNNFGKVPLNQAEPFYLLFQIAFAFEFERLGFRAIFTSSLLPFGYVIRNGYLTPLASDSDRNAVAWVHRGKGIDNSDVDGHAMTGVTANVFSQEHPQFAGTIVFTEVSPDHMRAENAPVVMAYINAMNTASAWLQVFDQTIHRPWSPLFKTNFPGVFYQMDDNYAALFDPANLPDIQAAMDYKTGLVNKQKLQASNPDLAKVLFTTPSYKVRTPSSPPTTATGQTAAPTLHGHTPAPAVAHRTSAPAIAKTPAPRAPTAARTPAPVRAPTTVKTSAPTHKHPTAAPVPTAARTPAPVHAPTVKTSAPTTKHTTAAPAHKPTTASPTVAPTAPKMPKRHEYETEYEYEEAQREYERVKREYEYEQPKQLTDAPSYAPTWTSPTHRPTTRPSLPSKSPTHLPTRQPSVAATQSPTQATGSPTQRPTRQPSEATTQSPTQATGSPTHFPTTRHPTVATESPTHFPTTRHPTVATESPTHFPTTRRPTVVTESPTHFPTTRHPTAAATKSPAQATDSPTHFPTTGHPTAAATKSPTTGSPTQPGWTTMRVTASQCAVFQLTPEIQSGAKPFTFVDGPYQLYVNSDGIYWLDSNDDIMSETEMFTTPIDMHTVSSIQISSNGIGVYINGVLQYSAPIPDGALDEAGDMTLFMDPVVMKAKEVSSDQCARRMLTDMMQADLAEHAQAQPTVLPQGVTAQPHTGAEYMPGFAALHDAPHPRLRGTAAQKAAAGGHDTEFTMPAPPTGQTLAAAASAALLMFVVGTAAVHRRATQRALASARDVKQTPEVAAKDEPVVNVAVMPASLVQELNMLHAAHSIIAPHTLQRLNMLLWQIYAQASDDATSIDVIKVQEAGILVASLTVASDNLTPEQIDTLHAIIKHFDQQVPWIREQIDPSGELAAVIRNLATALSALEKATRIAPLM